LALEKSEHNPNIFSGIFSEGLVFNALAEAATLNDPGPHHVCVLISRQMRSGGIWHQFWSFETHVSCQISRQTKKYLGKRGSTILGISLFL
jgi:hypothetical protein